MPNIEIAMPRISIPSIPAVNIEMPPIRISPRVRDPPERGPICCLTISIHRLRRFILCNLWILASNVWR